MQPQPEKIMPERCLQEIFCEHFKCPPENFQDKLFWMCIKPNVSWIAKICWVFNRRMFASDLEMLRQLGRTYNTRQLRYELESFRHYHKPRGFLRRDLKVRVSGRRLLKIASRLFSIEAARKARNLKIGISPEISAQAQFGLKPEQATPEAIKTPSQEGVIPNTGIASESAKPPQNLDTH